MKRKTILINRIYIQVRILKMYLYVSFLIKRARDKIDRLVSKTNNTTILKVSN